MDYYMSYIFNFTLQKTWGFRSYFLNTLQQRRVPPLQATADGWCIAFNEKINVKSM